MKKMFYPVRVLLLTVAAMIGTAAAKAQCVPPASITHSVTRCDSVSFSWPAAAGASGYIYSFNQTGITPTSGVIATGTSAQLGGLVPSTLYYLYVRANCTSSVSTWVRDSFTTPVCAAGICLAPATISLTNTGNTTLTYTWPAFAGAQGYEYVVDRTFANPTGSGTLVTTPTATVTGLTSGNLYYFHVRTKCGTNSYSSWKSSTANRTAGTDPSCPTPTQIQPRFLRCDTVSLIWGRAATHTSYLYALSTAATPSVTFALDSNFVERRSLIANTLYYVHVQANCTNARSAIGTDTFRTPACGTTTCLAPATVTYSSLTPTAANISWTAASGAIGYEYVLNQSTTNPTGNGTTVTATNISLTGLTRSTNYYLHLRTKCGATTYSAWKAAVILTTPASTAISNVPSGDASITVYPSPASQSVTIELEKEPGKEARLQLFSIDGRMIRAIAPFLKTVVDVRSLQSGIYFIRYSDQSAQKMIRFIKE